VPLMILNSQALHGGFEVLRWAERGIGRGRQVARGVLAEVVVFVVAGPGRRWLPVQDGPLKRHRFHHWFPAMAPAELPHGYERTELSVVVKAVNLASITKTNSYTTIRTALSYFL
jgi:hypothetical protein